jgi:hypothetical protein
MSARMVSRFVSGSRVAAIGFALALSPAPLAAQARDCAQFKAEVFEGALAYQRGARQSDLVAAAPTLMHRVAFNALIQEMRYWTKEYQIPAADAFATRAANLFCAP